MPYCALCGSTIEDNAPSPLCTWHGRGEEEGWAENNKVMCDFIHRGVPLPSLADVRAEGAMLAEEVNRPLPTRNEEAENERQQSFEWP